jgi:hypothetical protein
MHWAILENFSKGFKKMEAENVSSFDPTSALSSKFEDVSIVFPSCISTQLKVDPDFNETNIINGNNEGMFICVKTIRVVNSVLKLL